MFSFNSVLILTIICLRISFNLCDETTAAEENDGEESTTSTPTTIKISVPHQSGGQSHPMPARPLQPQPRSHASYPLSPINAPGIHPQIRSISGPMAGPQVRHKRRVKDDRDSDQQKEEAEEERNDYDEDNKNMGLAIVEVIPLLVG